MKRLAAFGRDARGATAIQFALVLVPLLMLGVGLLDVSRAMSAKQRLQDALDTAALLAARSSATTDTGLAAVGGPALSGNTNGVSIDSSSFHLAGSAVQATATTHTTPIIMGLWTGGNINITVNSEVVRSASKLEVALVLDNTGSMGQMLGSSQKLSSLKSAASGLVSTLAAGAARSSDPNAVKFAVVPFSMAVNVGSTYQNAAWISGAQPAAYGADIFNTVNTNRFTLLSQLGLTWAGCVEARPAPYDTQDTAPSASTPATLFVPYFAPDEPDGNKVQKNAWSTYVYYNNWITNDQTNSANHFQRQGNVAKYAASNSGAVGWGANGTGDFGPNRECGIAPLLRLTTDSNAATTKLNSMVAVGNTNVAQGLIWGWHVLSPNGPFADGQPYGTTGVQKVVVLLTDGDNTNNAGAESNNSNNPNDSIYTGIGYIWQKRLLDANNVAVDVGSSGDQRRDAIDSRELKTCANMKAQGIVIYAIGVGVSSHSQAVLQSCASGADHYFDVTDASQLNAIFQTIAGSIGSLRISR